MTVNANKKVEVRNTISAKVGFKTPAGRSMDFGQRGARRTLPFEELEQSYYEPGVEYLFRHGILYIEDMDVKKALGLEEEDATQPTNVVVLTNKEMEELLKESPVKEFNETLVSMSKEQKTNLAQYAIETEIDNMRKGRALQDATGIDVLGQIANNQDIEEDK